MFNNFVCSFQSLKESYVKAIGIGLNIDLQRIEFRLPSYLQVGTCTCDTRVLKDGQVQNNWRFEETMLDDTHSVAVALCSPVSIYLKGEGVVN